MRRSYAGKGARVHRPCHGCGRLGGCEVLRRIRNRHGGRPEPADVVAWIEHGIGITLDPWQRWMALQALDIDFNKFKIATQEEA